MTSRDLNSRSAIKWATLQKDRTIDTVVWKEQKKLVSCSLGFCFQASLKMTLHFLTALLLGTLAVNLQLVDSFIPGAPKFKIPDLPNIPDVSKVSDAAKDVANRALETAGKLQNGQSGHSSPSAEPGQSPAGGNAPPNDGRQSPGTGSNPEAPAAKTPSTSNDAAKSSAAVVGPSFTRFAGALSTVLVVFFVAF